MKQGVVTVLKLVIASLAVVFGMFFLLNGQINGGIGIFGGLQNNPYNEMEKVLENSVSSEMGEIGENEEFPKLEYDQTICYVYNPSDADTITEFYEKFEIKEGYADAVYEWDKVTRTWISRNDSTKKCYFYIEDIKDEEGNSVLKIGDIAEYDSEEFNDSLLYNDRTGEIAFFRTGSYIFYIKITNDKNVSTIVKVLIPVTYDY